MVDNNENNANPIDEHQEHVINYVKSLAAIVMVWTIVLPHNIRFGLFCVQLLRHIE